MNSFDLAVSKYPKLYLVSRKLDLATHEQVDELERQWGFALPNGYREFITTVGACEYCHNLMIIAPATILKEPDLTIGRITGDYNPWSPADSGLTKEQIMELLNFGSTANGDYVGLHPTQPGMIFFLPEGDDDIIRVDSRQVPFPDYYWQCVGDGLWGADFPYAQSYSNRHYAQINLVEVKYFDGKAFTKALTDRWSKGGLHIEPRSNVEVETYFLRAIDGWIALSWYQGSPSTIAYSVDKDALADVTEFFKGLGLA